MDWNSLVAVGVTGVLSALAYQATKGDKWPAGVNMVLGSVVAYFAGFSGLVDQLPSVALEGNGAEGVFAAFAASFAHGQLFKGKALGDAVKLGLAPRLLNLLSEATGGLAKAAKNDKPPAP